MPLLYLKVGQQPVLYRTEDASLRAFQLDSGARPQRFADDAVLHAWLTQLRERFPTCKCGFARSMLRFMIQNVGSPHQSRMRSWLPLCRNIVSIGSRHNCRRCPRFVQARSPGRGQRSG